jgi:predicted nucleic acid-binding protein
LNVLVDTSVWSLSLRRRPSSLAVLERSIFSELAELIQESRVRIIGSIRQEILSGIREEAYYARLRDYLRSFDDEPLTKEDYENAAAASNTCRSVGITGSAIDMLICAVAIQRQWPVFTNDKDFLKYARYLPLEIYSAPDRKH